MKPPSRWKRRAFAGLAVAVAAAGVVWWFTRVRLPEVPSPGLDPSADPVVVADVAAARDGVLKQPRSAEAWGEYGIVLRAYELHHDADVCFGAATALDPSDGRWPYLLGTHLAATDPTAAVEWLKKAAGATVPESARETVRLRLVETLLESNRTGEARAALGPEPPSSPRAKLAAAGIAAAEGDDRAVSVWLADLGRYPAAARTVLVLRADICRRQGRTSYAGLLSERAAAAPNVRWPDPLVDPIQRRNRSRASRMDQAAALLRIGRPLEAERLLLPMTTEEKPDARAFVGLAEARSALGDRAGAAEALAAAIRVDPTNTSANYQLGVHHFDAGERLWHDGKPEAARERFREAVGRFDLALSTSPNFGKALLLKGVAWNRFLGRPEDGLALIRRYIELRPEISEGYLLYGQALADGGRVAEAAAALRWAADMAEPGDRRAADLLDKLTQPPADRR